MKTCRNCHAELRDVFIRCPYCCNYISMHDYHFKLDDQRNNKNYKSIDLVNTKNYFIKWFISFSILIILLVSSVLIINKQRTIIKITTNKSPVHEITSINDFIKSFQLLSNEAIHNDDPSALSNNYTMEFYESETTIISSNCSIININKGTIHKTEEYIVINSERTTKTIFDDSFASRNEKLADSKLYKPFTIEYKQIIIDLNQNVTFEISSNTSLKDALTNPIYQKHSTSNYIYITQTNIFVDVIDLIRSENKVVEKGDLNYFKFENEDAIDSSYAKVLLKQYSGDYLEEEAKESLIIDLRDATKSILKMASTGKKTINYTNDETAYLKDKTVIVDTLVDYKFYNIGNTEITINKEGLKYVE